MDRANGDHSLLEVRLGRHQVGRLLGTGVLDEERKQQILQGNANNVARP